MLQKHWNLDYVRSVSSVIACVSDVSEHNTRNYYYLFESHAVP